LRRTLAETDVDLRLGAEYDPAGATAYDEVVLATGGDWTSTLPGARTVPDLADWLTADDDTVGAPVLVLGTGAPALRIAQQALVSGRATPLATPARYVAPELGARGRHRHIEDYLDAGGRLVLRTPDDAGGELVAGAAAVIDVRPRVGTPLPEG